MKPMSQTLREKIKIAIKNGQDISDLIKDVDIRGEILDRAIIKDFNRFNGDISKASFVRAIIGEEGKVINLSHVNANGCNFKYAKFLGTLELRNARATNCNFCGAFIPSADYRNADFRGSVFCGTIFALSNWAGSGAKFDKKVFEMIFKHWGIDLTQEGEENA